MATAAMEVELMVMEAEVVATVAVAMGSCS